MVSRRSRLLGSLLATVLGGALLGAVPGLAAAAVTCPAVDPGTGTVTPPPSSGLDWSGCDLAGANLSGLALTQMNLTGADLQGANLSDTSFPNTNLTDADIAGAKVSGADLTGALLIGLHSGGLSGPPAAVPVRYTFRAGYIFGPSTDLRGAALAGTDLSSLELESANLTDVSLAGANLVNTDMIGATLTGSTLAHANLTGTDLADTDLAGVDLTGAQLDDTAFSDDNLSGRDFAGGGCNDCAFGGANLANANFKGATLVGSRLTGANLAGADLTNANLRATDMAGTRLAGARLAGVLSVSVTGAPQSLPPGWSVTSGYLIGPGADLAGTFLERAYLFGADLTGANLKGADLASATLSAAQLAGANLTGANLSRATLTGAELTAGSAIMSKITWTKATCPNGKLAPVDGCFPVATKLVRGRAVTLSVTTGAPASSVRVSGSGLKGRERLAVTFGKTRRLTVTTSSKGRFGPVSVTVPGSAQPGLSQITATGTARGQVAAAWFTVQTSWTQTGFGPALNADNTLENTLTPAAAATVRRAWSLTPSWPANAAPVDANAPVVAAGLAYVTGHEGPLYAVNTATGRALWHWSANTGNLNPAYSAPAIANGVVYINVGGVIYAIGRNGQPFWPIAMQLFPGPPPTPYNLSSAPTVANGTVYVAGNAVQALNAATGASRWAAATLPGLAADGVCNQPAVASGVVYASCNNGDLYALSAATGTVLWSYTSPDGGLAAPAVAGDAVYVTDTVGGRVYAISTKTHKPLWTHLAGASAGHLATTPVVANQHVYVGAGQYLLALSASTGKLAWAAVLTSAPVPFSYSPAAADGVIYDLGGNLSEYAVNAVSGKILWRYTNGTSLEDTPVVVNGALFNGTGAGGLIAFRAR
jgi:uncharacterized protein YjbI with pentapeptide repeats/outer membrane protein assembly factor BamB